jgi:hypothetical protein
MRPRHALWMIALGLLSPGCALVGASVETVAYKAREGFLEHKERSRDWKWAEAAWRDVCSANPQTSCSRSFAEGFKTGYAEYLYAGEPGTPPALPPRQYRGVAFQTPAGYRVIEDWFAGYRYGVVVARSEGYRDLIIGPNSLSGPPMPGPSPEPPPPDAVQEPAEKPLPPPRRVQAPVLQFQVPAVAAAPGPVEAPVAPSGQAQGPVLQFPLPTAAAAPRPVEAPVAPSGQVQGPVLRFQLPGAAAAFKSAEAPVPTWPAQGPVLRVESADPNVGAARGLVGTQSPDTPHPNPPPSCETSRVEGVAGSPVLRLEMPTAGGGREPAEERLPPIGELPAQ